MEEDRGTGVQHVDPSMAMSAVRDVLARMEEVEEAMIEFRDYLTTQDDQNKSFHDWARYTKYDAISDAVDKLVNTVANLKSEDSIERITSSQSLRKARIISTSISNITVAALNIMDRKTMEYVNSMDHVTHEASAADDNTRHVLMVELGKMLKYSTSATDSIWEAMDTLAKMEQARGPPKKSMLNDSWDWGKWLGLVLTILLFCSYMVFTFTNPTADSLLQACARSNDLHRVVADGNANLYALLRAQGEQIEINNLIFDYQIETLRNQTNLVSEKADANGLRIDNIWEALGPPNANGTYYSHGDTRDTTIVPSDENTSKRMGAQLKDVNKKIEGSVERLKKQIEGIKKDWQRADLRLSTRLDRVERYGH
ncbi:hypothetical protein P280DRAFT_505481 [Massarina eburnea CBS 473.64]|uniref:Uncharacterized protein n=1 Tax=Massarina eburnea CBS 473.64 TaxID=1395130 RepID=A0A6A6S6S1_9PLEO|nr:hypothetical protein P280DRAFT_505481 [Massarina eburnea CBS 473.64]